MMDGHSNYYENFIMYVSEIIKLNTLNLHNAVFQLYFNKLKINRKKERGKKEKEREKETKKEGRKERERDREKEKVSGKINALRA